MTAPNESPETEPLKSETPPTDNVTEQLRKWDDVGFTWDSGAVWGDEPSDITAPPSGAQ